MKYAVTITSLLLAASSALAAPSLAARSGNLVITGLSARASSQSRTSTISFSLNDPDNNPTDTPTECELVWGPNGSPSGTCTNSKYSVGFGATGQNIYSFTIEVERVEATAVQGEFSVDDQAAGTKWTCAPQPGAVQCNYDGDLIVPV